VSFPCFGVGAEPGVELLGPELCLPAGGPRERGARCLTAGDELVGLALEPLRWVMLALRLLPRAVFRRLPI